MNPTSPSKHAGLVRMDDLPAEALEYVRDMCSGPGRAAFIRVDRIGRVVAWGGAIDDYFPHPILPGMPADELSDVLSGLMPPSGGTTVFPMIELQSGRFADVHLVPDPDGGWVFLFDSTAEAERRRALQQYAHELALSSGKAPRPGSARATRRAPPDEAVGAYGMTGRSAPMREVYELISDVAAVDATVLILGETGTGKELVARAIHMSSSRRDKPLVVVNCAGLSDSLINSQLFGHKKGAFTDAVSDQKGFMEAADGGTILLDEIGDIPMNTQTRILRALEQKEIVRIGETTPRSVDVRILSATHKDLDEEVRKGAFRQDLLYRIRVARISLPPLRSRREDIPLIAGGLLDRLAHAFNRKPPAISEEATDLLLAHQWPGNVRELRNAIEFAMIRCKSGVIQPADLPPEIVQSKGTAGATHRKDRSADRKAILAALDASRGRRDQAAEALGVSRATLYRRMKACGLDPGRRT